MVKAADFEPEEALKIQEQQGQRLTRLRARLGFDQNDAAKLGMIDRDAWGRMERGTAKINPIALHRFIAAVTATGAGVTAEYVITGRLVGLDDDLIRELLEAEALEKHGLPVDTALSTGKKPRGRKRRKSMHGTPTSGL